MSQCQGVTKKGERCKIIVKQDPFYCSYHVSQATSNRQTKTTKRKPGYIYIFTLPHLITSHPSTEKWLRQAPSNLEQSNLSHETTQIFNPKYYILLKIGFTTQLITKRLKQWQDQCCQKFTLVGPDSINDIISSKKYKSIITLFKHMNLQKTSKLYKNYDYTSKGFKCHESAFESEQLIHSILRKKYGFGTLYCQSTSSCSSKDHNGVHKEWFLIPRKDIAKLMTLIDETVK
ncbi:hypothetical protein CANARDRAFT_195296 [[Candida] arabinofermentans NRRL YB-2248]|uniref:Bacteriophage T5 Orf172 DNA-binding domain-containing protein n=1 Tax=[Candida] arabinofermentans NRRL YB-2248 TaxID=983967 RepID=A0A1E4T5K1_9ASCO|nr:hypothetical protein CANARDRAFT_195296 [[Candida] arabinofermentans NRRL YB-2248]